MTKSVSVHSNASTSMSMSKFNSQNISDFSTESSLKNSFPLFPGVIRSQDQSKKMDIAVKQLSRRGLQGHKEWVTEVNVLGVVEHPNLVKLMGYCVEDGGIQRLLVYEYMQNKSVQDHSFNQLWSPLPWTTRMRVSQDAARGLAYLHEGMDFERLQIFQHTFDDKWNAKLSDFGLARLGPSDGLSHVSTAVVGTIGYAAPEYLLTGHLMSKSDVLSYGVYLYELITGRRPLDRSCPKNEQKLLEWVRPHLNDAKKFSLILDPRLEGNYNLNEVLEMVNKIMNASENGNPMLPTSKREYLKRVFTNPLVGENRCLSWRTWRPNVIRTC
ncbi:hypothetical protein K2173_011654 [Erythroxylum novogranatense]|uniref:Protein kinase domain-containing protein n=1 Tax=Erythroxylum novogranatense TaxID=1862640 RepID=A0AAV8T0H3_9ROSI|nr:hypothetical protein K2173_011654 [Erythroxylum novogranatense]